MGFTRAQMTAIAVATGYPVKAAWTAGHGVMGDIAGVLLHHTATPDSIPGDYPSLRIVTQGRADLPGPLCNYGLGRSGTIYLVSEGIGWHAGPGAWKGVTAGNTHLIGIEAENGGTGKPWPAVQIDAYQRLTASILHAIGRGTDWDLRHAAWALPSGRKVDTAGISMNEFDAAVRGMLADPLTINRNHTGADDMSQADVDAIKAYIDKKVAEVPLVVWGHKLTQAWDGADNEAGDVLASAQRYAIEAGFAGSRPKGNGNPGTPTLAKQLLDAAGKTVAQTDTLEASEAAQSQALADAAKSITDGVVSQLLGAGVAGIDEPKLRQVVGAAVHDQLAGTEFVARPAT